MDGTALHKLTVLPSNERPELASEIYRLKLQIQTHLVSTVSEFSDTTEISLRKSDGISLESPYGVVLILRWRCQEKKAIGNSDSIATDFLITVTDHKGRQ